MQNITPEHSDNNKLIFYGFSGLRNSERAQVGVWHRVTPIVAVSPWPVVEEGKAVHLKAGKASLPLHVASGTLMWASFSFLTGWGLLRAVRWLT